MTIISVLWSRVELQVLRYMPWWIIQKHQHVASDGYDLDYTEMLLPLVLVQSIKRRHFLVAVVSIITLLLKTRIVLSSNIFQVVNVGIKHPVQAHVLDYLSPETDIAQILESNSSVKARVEGYRQFNMDLPFGVADKCAYQTFSFPFEEGPTPGRPTINAPLTAVVDGLFMETECLMLETYPYSITEAAPESTNLVSIFNIIFELKFENCETVISRGMVESIGAIWSLEDQPADDRPCSILP